MSCIYTSVSWKRAGWRPLADNMAVHLLRGRTLSFCAEITVHLSTIEKKQAFPVHSLPALLTVRIVNINSLIEWYRFDETMRRQRKMRILRQASCSCTDTPRVHQGSCRIVHYTPNKPSLNRSLTFFPSSKSKSIGTYKKNTIFFLLSPQNEFIKRCQDSYG